MRKILVVTAVVLTAAFATVFTIRHASETHPYRGQQSEVETTPPVDPYTAELASEQFIRGYEDAQGGIVVGTIKWIFSKDYRVGHMLGTHDKKTKINRFAKK